MEYENSSIVPTEFSISYLGEYLYSILSKRVEDAYDVLYKIVREWSVDFAVQKLLNLMVLINPCLNRHRRAQLEPLLTRSLDQLLWQRAMDPRVMRGLITLACPNQDTALLFGYLMEIIAGLVCNNPTLEENSKNIDVEAASSNTLQIPHEKAKVAQCLYQNYCLQQVYVAAMPSLVREAVLTALMGGSEVPLLGSGFFDGSPSGLQHAAPICCITLEPLLCPDGTIAPDVVAVIQRSSTLSTQHAFLYRGRALFEWLSSSPVPKSPETRAMVLPTDIYRLS
ncbi:uncharacterized protein [Physcomitrium patens]|uniref:Uncharacterized protein n=1 Tax=Physcomitrium patens TaxID=3218 RepID=A0A2K1JGC4_PHYPA|nr:uncharacterized protein LOC112291622 [Physcomitrium patens]PNR40603.1 hypothetical protein PHYPA_018006 [Physcomitrium patens]|eukprot:XP_024395069.1 uncharacterized protein LOC112291622 [Physcomitrella patens]